MNVLLSREPARLLVLFPESLVCGDCTEDFGLPTGQDTLGSAAARDVMVCWPDGNCLFQSAGSSDVQFDINACSYDRLKSMARLGYSHVCAFCPFPCDGRVKAVESVNCPAEAALPH